MRLSIISWNVLADCYIHGMNKLQQNYNQDSEIPNYLLWQGRFEKIMNVITQTKADIYCLQEVDHYEDFKPFLSSIGYDSVYLQRPRKGDGCLIAYHSDKLLLQNKFELQLDDLSSLKNDSTYLKQNVALLLKLSLLSSEAQFVVACCHIHWNPNLEELKYNQARYILSSIYNFASLPDGGGMLPVIFTGDFNSFPDSKVYGLLSQPFGNTVFQLENTTSIDSPASLRQGADVKFLCEPSLSRLCRWMRVLGLDVAMDSWESSPSPSDPASLSAQGEEKRQPSKARVKHSGINHFFQRARDERRIILTSSRGLRERSACPPSVFVRPNDLERALISIYRDFGLDLNQERFLTVCGKCGGNIVEADCLDKRLMGRIFPCDRPVYSCVTCAQVIFVLLRFDIYFFSMKYILD